jgi:N-acyl-D-aspartate/D-glutamate deacylase
MTWEAAPVPHDLVIRGGTVVDGTGGPPRLADVAVDGGVITSIEDAARPGAEELDAHGLLVTPGFVDPHTHLDAQLCWDPAASPTSLHGVTTVVVGICGFGVAPCPPGGGEYLLRSLERVEEIPYESTAIGVPFAWETWPEYFDHLASLPLGVNVAGMVPHSPLRYAVMGERARREVAGPEDRRALAGTLRAALEGGALGFATSRGPNHVDAFGDPVPSRLADDLELRALVSECAGRPWQINVETKFAGDAAALLAEVDRYAAWTADAGARLTWTPFFAEPGNNIWQRVLEHHRELNDRVAVLPQVIAQPVTAVLRFDRPSVARAIVGWEEVMEGFFAAPPAVRAALLRDDAFREVLRSAPEDCERALAPCYDEWLIARAAAPDLVGRTLGAAARARGVAPSDLMCDLAVEDGLHAEFQVPVVNRDRRGSATLIADRHTLAGLGDSGAHVTSVTSYTYTTDTLARLARDEGALSVAAAVERLTSRPARFFGITGRGELRPGYAADLCVIDLPTLAVGPLDVRTDLPGGAARLYRSATGYAAIFVNGIATVRAGQATGRPAGRVVRAT